MNKIILALALVACINATTQAAPVLNLSDSYCTKPAAQFFDLAQQNAYNLVNTSPILGNGPTPAIARLTRGLLPYIPLLPNFYTDYSFKLLDPNVAKQSGLGIEKWWEVFKGNQGVDRTNFGFFEPAISQHANYYDHKAQLVQSLADGHVTDTRNKAMAEGLKEAEKILFGDPTSTTNKDGILNTLSWYKNIYASKPAAIDHEFSKTTGSDDLADATRNALRQQYESIVDTRRYIENACRSKGAHAEDIKQYLDKVMPLPNEHVATFEAATNNPIRVLSHCKKWLSQAWHDMLNFGDKAFHGGTAKSGKDIRGELAKRFLTHGTAMAIGYQAGKYIGKKCGSEWVGKRVGALLALGLSYHFDAPSHLGIE
ncbi:hypothetical protein FJ365_00430 [Candidatus Dependentiae bacterium]|nr:hypothetical protein [Candidatus Dependentiae bacterium]